MSDTLLVLGLLSLGLLFVAGLLGLGYQYWRSRAVRVLAIALGTCGGIGVVVMFGALLFPAGVLAPLAQLGLERGLLLNGLAIALCIAIAYWREQQDRRKGSGAGRAGAGRDRPLTPWAGRRGPGRKGRSPARQPSPQNRQEEALGRNPSQSPTSARWGSRKGDAGKVRQLNALTHSRETSERLVNGLLAANPGRDRRWAVERAIADLERDRRG
jgi:hypothetical protein